MLLSNLVASTSLPTANTSAAQIQEIPIPAPAVISATSTEPDPLDLWLDKLALLESNGREDIKHLDVNGRYSYSCLQFQMGTFKAFYPLIASRSPASWEKAIMDCDTQKSIARAMLAANPAAWRHWYHSVKKRGLGLPPI